MECELLGMTESKKLEMPFWLKLNLTIKEASAYSNIGIKRKEFEQYISRSLEI